MSNHLQYVKNIIVKNMIIRIYDDVFFVNREIEKILNTIFYLLELEV